MARPARSGRPGKPKFSSHKANAAGYAKRHSNKSKINLSDVYDYQPEKVRRGNVSLTLDKEEAAEWGRDGSDEDDGIDQAALRARLIGENVDDEKIDSEDDEELDSDAAFEESDEETYAGFSFGSKVRRACFFCSFVLFTQRGVQSKQKSKAKKASKPKKTSGVRFAEVDLNEDESADEAPAAEAGSSSEEEEEEEGDSDEFIDVLDVLDGRGEPDLGEDEGKASVRKDSAGRTEHEAEDEEMEEDEDEGDEEGQEYGEDEDDENVVEEEGMDLSADEADESPEALDSLGKFISSLDTGTKRKAEGAELEAPRRKRRVIQERTEAGAENEFAANVTGMLLRPQLSLNM